MLTILVVALVVLALAGGAYYVYTSSSPRSQKRKTRGKDASSPMGPVSMDDFVKFFNRLSPDSTHLEILFGVLAMDDVLDRAAQDLEKISELRDRRKKQIKEEEEKAKSNKVDFTDLVDADGWGAEEDDDDDGTNDNDDGDEQASAEKAKAQKAKEEEKRKAAELASLRKATGKTLPPLEGLDEGVLGQQWVEATLKASGVWPPELGAIGQETFEYYPPGSSRAKLLKPLDHPAFRRCLCMTMGRLHSSKLNNHPELVKAGLSKMVDETYFKGAMEFRQRLALILDAALRIALSIQSYPLFGTLVETLSAFKVGCVPNDPKALPWFNGTMARQYNTLPRLDIGDVHFEAPSPEEEKQASGPAKKEEQEPPVLLTELLAGEKAVVVLPVDRTHAEAFTKVKVAQCQAQGIPPQIALQGYREAWWFVVKWEPTSKGVENDVEEIPRKFLEQLDPRVMSRFENSSPNDRVRTAFPMMVQNIAQQKGQVKVKIDAPKNPGTYKLTLAVKSQDFLGADKEITVQMKVGENSNAEPKKDK